MAVTVIIGKNFGDEGKGLAADYFAMKAVRIGASAICVRHNGGAQAGHTVDRPDRRFVFSQLSSASFRGIGTYWADSFLPDLFPGLQPFRACFKGVKMLVGSPKLAIASANSSVTAISEGGHVKSGSDNRYYNLQGQRVNQPHQGLYIVNGKKVIIK